MAAHQNMGRVKTDAKRRAILDASARVFSAKGYHGAAVSDIAEDVGMGLGTFYRYFENKLAVFHAVIEEVLIEVANAVAIEDPTSATSLERYRAQMQRIGDGLFDAFNRNRQLAQLLFVEAPGIDAALNQKLHEATAAFGAMMQLYLKHGVDQGYLRSDLDIEATALIINAMTFEGVRHVARADDGAQAKARFSQAIIALMFDGIRAR